MTETFRWLHLTDLHWGDKLVKPRWNNLKMRFFDKLQELAGDEQCGGPWDVVFFTGDLVNRGTPSQYKSLNEEFLLELWEKLSKNQGDPPILVPVPGNHDLTRPRKTKRIGPILHSLKCAFEPRRGMAADMTIQKQFWTEKKDGSYRGVVTKAFANYQKWWKELPVAIPKMGMRPGLLPGEFTATIRKGSKKIGIMGLNSAFLQLEGGNYYKKLAMNLAQSEQASGDIGRWERDHHLCILLTHHPSDWLAPASLEEYRNEISPTGRFAVHLSGHTHNNDIVSVGKGGPESRITVSTLSLYGNKHYIDKDGSEKEDRIHGFGAGRIDFGKENPEMRFWAIQDQKLDGGGWLFRDAPFQANQKDGSIGPFATLYHKIEVEDPHSDLTDSAKENNLEPPTQKMITRISQILALPKFKGLADGLILALEFTPESGSENPVKALITNRDYVEIHDIWYQAVNNFLESLSANLDDQTYTLLLECMGWIVLKAVRRGHFQQKHENRSFLHFEIPVSFEFSFAIVFGEREGVFAQFSFDKSTDQHDPLEAMGMVCRPKLPDRGGELLDWLNATCEIIWQKTEIDPRQYHGEFKNQAKLRSVNFNFHEMAEELKYKIEEANKPGPKVKPFLLINPEKEPMTPTEIKMARELHQKLDLPIVAYGGQENIWEGVKEKQIKVKLEYYFSLLRPYRDGGN